MSEARSAEVGGQVVTLPYTGTLVDGTAVVVSLKGVEDGIGLWVNPAVGDTVRVRYRVSADAPWQAWPKGDRTAYADDRYVGDLNALEFSRVAGTGTTSKFGVTA